MAAGVALMSERIGEGGETVFAVFEADTGIFKLEIWTLSYLLLLERDSRLFRRSSEPFVSFLAIPSSRIQANFLPSFPL